MLATLPLKYRSEDGHTEIELTGDRYNLWLSTEQLAALYGVSEADIEQEVLAAQKETEADDKPIVKDIDGKPAYALELALTVGYRVAAPQAIKFRQWATRTLAAYLREGYIINQRQLHDQNAVNTILKRALRSNMQPMVREDFLELLERYEHGLGLLDQYDMGTLERERYREDDHQEEYILTYEDARAQVDRWKQSRYGEDREPLEGTPAYKLDLFGIEKDGGFRSSIDAIYTTYFGEPVYPSLEEKAANLIYFLVKNHSFSDGNKRIAAGLFLYYMERNNMLYRKDGQPRIADNALVALTLFIAMSPSDQQDAVVAMTVNLIDDKN